MGILLLPAPLHANPPPLIFGVFPNLSAKLLIETYRPMADALQKQLGRPVELYSAPDFKIFVARTRGGEYDILLTAPHLAWLARQDAGYRPLLKYAEPVRGLLIVKDDSPIQGIGQLRGTTLAISDPLAVVVIAMLDRIRSRGLNPGADFTTENAHTHSNAAIRVFNGAAAAAIIGSQPYRHLPPEVNAHLRVIAETPPLSSQMFLTHPRLSDAESLAIRQALQDFAVSPGGRTFMEHGGFGGLAEVDGRELREFRSYAEQALRAVR
jgi:phosphonate transport system substrate-binding protein